MHSGAIDSLNRLRHERRVEVILLGDRLQRVLERHGLIGGGQRIVVLEADLVLANRDLVMAGLDLDPELLERPDHIFPDLAGEIG